METGAFAMFDALGIRDIWKRHDADVVLRKFDEIEFRFKSFADRQLGGAGHPNTKRPDNSIKRVKIGFISDTVVVGFIMKDARTPHFAVMMAARWAAEAFRLGVNLSPAWSYRGVVTYGQFSINDAGNFFVGPAVTEAASLYERAEAAVIWLAPSAKGALKGATASDFRPGRPYHEPTRHPPQGQEEGLDDDA